MIHYSSNSLKLGALILAALPFSSVFVGCTGKNANNVSTNQNVESMFQPLDTIDSISGISHICTSEDGNMRFYSWFTGEGGSMPIYGVICQFRTSDGKSKAIDFSELYSYDPAWVSDVHSLTKDDGTKYYIATRSHSIANNDDYMWMDAFKIDCDTLKQVSELDGSDILDSEKGSVMSVNYYGSRWNDASSAQEWDWWFNYDVETKDVYVPLSIDLDESIPILSDRYRVYHFDGMKFVDKGEYPHKGLHESLCDYKQLILYFLTENHIVRIDRVDDKGTLRYASWKSTSNTSEKPDIVIMDGKCNYDDYNSPESYTFINGGYEYIVDYQESHQDPDGIPYIDEFLLVKKDGKVVLKEEKWYPECDI